MNQEKYFDRIGLDAEKISPDLQSLKLLQRQHLLRVPFENLDIHWKKPILLETENLYRKIVEEKRGGFCYELNGLFYALLDYVGFRSKLISARVSKGNGDFGPEKDHMAILTEIAGEEYLVDVGFGSFIAEPLKFVLDVEQTDETGIYSIRKYNEDYYLVAKKEGDKWSDEIIFRTQKYDLKDFAEMCRYHQTSPESHFTKNKVCSLMTNHGRKTLTDSKYIETVDGEKSENKIRSESEFNLILEREFSIKPDFEAEKSL